MQKSPSSHSISVSGLDSLSVRVGLFYLSKTRCFPLALSSSIWHAPYPFHVLESFLQVPPHLQIILRPRRLNFCQFNQKKDSLTNMFNQPWRSFWCSNNISTFQKRVSSLRTGRCLGRLCSFSTHLRLRDCWEKMVVYDHADIRFFLNIHGSRSHTHQELLLYVYTSGFK